MSATLHNLLMGKGSGMLECYFLVLAIAINEIASRIILGLSGVLKLIRSQQDESACFNNVNASFV